MGNIKQQLSCRFTMRGRGNVGTMAEIRASEWHQEGSENIPFPENKGNVKSVLRNYRQIYQYLYE